MLDRIAWHMHKQFEIVFIIQMLLMLVGLVFAQTVVNYNVFIAVMLAIVIGSTSIAEYMEYKKLPKGYRVSTKSKIIIFIGAALIIILKFWLLH